MLQVTVLMPLYNGMPYLEASIRSILEQSYADFEFLILDDASTDASRTVVQGFDDPRIRLVFNEKNLGQTATLNVGLKLASVATTQTNDRSNICVNFTLQCCPPAFCWPHC